MSTSLRSVLNVFPEMSIARDPSTRRFPFLYPRQERKAKLVEDIVIYDQVILRTEHFRELAWISTWLPSSVLKELLKTEALRLVWDPWLLTSSSGVSLVSSHGSPQAPEIPRVFGGRILDVCGLPGTIPEKVVEAFQEVSPYEKQEIYQIADIVEESTTETNEHYFREAKASDEADLSSYEFLSSCFEALTGKDLDQSVITLHGNDVRVFPYDGYVILTNIYLAIMAELDIAYLRSPRYIQRITTHKSRWLGRKLSLAEDVRKNLTHLYKVTGVPNIRVLFQKGIINETNILELRTSAKEFRAWLHLVIESQRAISGDDHTLLRAYISSLEKVSSVNNLPFKTLRFAITSGVGLIPVIGNVVSIGLSAFDTFLLEKLVEGWQPKVFVNKLRSLGND